MVTFDVGAAEEGAGLVGVALLVMAGEVEGGAEDALVDDVSAFGVPSLHAAPTSERMQTNETRAAREDRIVAT